MIKLAKDIAVDRIENMRGGKFATTLTHFMTEAESQNVGKSFTINALPPGGSIGYHQHVGNFEVYYLLSGTATVEDNEKKRHTLNAGDAMICPDGESHSIENVGDGELSFVSVILHSR